MQTMPIRQTARGRYALYEFMGIPPLSRLAMWITDWWRLADQNRGMEPRMRLDSPTASRAQHIIAVAKQEQGTRFLPRGRS